jgi:hypothetical protein
LKNPDNPANVEEREIIESYLKGDTKSKVAAVDKLFRFLKIDADYSLTKLKILASKTQPGELRLYVAENMSGKGLTTKQFFDILKTLSEDPDEKLLEFIKKRQNNLTTSLTGIYNSIGNAALENLKFQNISEIMNLKSLSIIDDLNRAQWKFMDSISRFQPYEFDKLTAKHLESVFDFSRLVPDMNDIISKSQSAIDELMKKQRSQLENLSTKYIQSFTESPEKQLLKSLTENQTRWLGKASIFDSAKPLVSFVQLNDIALRPITDQIKRTPSFYGVQELEPVTSPSSTPATKKAKLMLAKLKSCEPGHRDWIKFQDICMEILSHCLVPPLLDPTEQSETQDKSHRRDLIYNIPHGAGPFWSYVTLKYGLGIIVECKNYRDPLKENEMIISSKYFDKKKLTALGLIITRKGLDTTGLKAQQDLWREQEKMLLCLEDNDMAKMLELKDRGEDPWKVIDFKEREFRSSF